MRVLLHELVISSLQVRELVIEISDFLAALHEGSGLRVNSLRLSVELGLLSV
jgi:hypothetical protein